MVSQPENIGVEALIRGWDGFLLDAYGVLVDGAGALPGAADFLARLRAARKPFWIVTNDASRLPETTAARLRSLALEVEPNEILTSGSLLRQHFAEAGLQGKRCLVLGTPDSATYVERAGGLVTEPAYDADYDAIIVCDDAGFPFLDTVEVALTVLYRQCDDGRPPALILPNPDVVYPKGPGQFGFTAGAIAHLLELALARRFSDRAPTFTRLGKPFPGLFLAAARLAPGLRLVMVGDQLETDIAGARAAGIDAVLVGTGLCRWQNSSGDRRIAVPTHLLPSLLHRGS